MATATAFCLLSERLTETSFKFNSVALFKACPYKFDRGSAIVASENLNFTPVDTYSTYPRTFITASLAANLDARDESLSW